MARKERNIIVNIIENKNIKTNVLIEFFAKKFNEKNINNNQYQNNNN